MKNIASVVLGVTLLAAPAAAQEWPEDMVRPATYPWEALWPLNNAEDVSWLMLGGTYLEQEGKYHKFGEERHPSGMANNYSYRVKFRPDLPGGDIVKRIVEMKIGDTEAFTSTGIAGEVKLVGTEHVGPHTCSQVEWTMRKTSNVIIGNKEGKVSKLELYCLDPAKGNWFNVEKATGTAG